MSEQRNVSLIGMPGAGKSTVGVVLAKRLSMGFVDTDVVIQQGEGRRLQALIDELGMAAFKELEGRYVGELQCERTVIATGGSVVYSAAAMEHLREMGPVVLLDLHWQELEDRVRNLPTRGVVMAPGQTLRDLYEERHDLYHQWADVEIDCTGRDHEEVLAALIEAVGR